MKLWEVAALIALWAGAIVAAFYVVQTITGGR